MVERAQLLRRPRIALGEPFHRQPRPALGCPRLRHRFTVPGYVGPSAARGNDRRRPGRPGRACARRARAPLGARRRGRRRPAPARAAAAARSAIPRALWTVRLVVARRAGTVVGIALLSRAMDGSTVLHYVVDPDAGARTATSSPARSIRRAVAEAPPGAPLHLWAMQAGPADDELAHDNGFSPERDLLQMRVTLAASPTMCWPPPARWPPGPSCPDTTRRRGSRRTTAPSPATPNRAAGRSNSSATAWLRTGSSSTASWWPTTRRRGPHRVVLDQDPP